MRSRILVIPAVPDLDSFGRLIGHLGHYFGHVAAERIVVLVEPGLLREAEEWLAAPSLPAGYDDRVVARIDGARSAITVEPTPSDFEALRDRSDLVLDWDVQASEREPWQTVKSRYRPNRTIFAIDWRGTRQGAAWAAEAARILVQGRPFDRSQTERFGELAVRLGRAERAYLVATGPSARAALDRDMSDGIRIVCNTVVLDDELMAHVRPDVLTFADPIFHFGPSTYAQRFQRAVEEQARKHDFTVVTTERYAPLLRAHLPEVADRIIGLRQATERSPDNFDLRSNAAVRAYPNVLTMLMLPIAATFAQSIRLIGFDGRAPGEDYFWRHGSTVQFEAELSDIRLVHPGFFEIDYSNYYDEHVATVERMFSEMEQRGLEILPMADSHIPALRRRSKRTATPYAGACPSLISLTPDWLDAFGHFGPFERRLHEAAELAGQQHVALANVGLRPDADWQLPTFSEPTFAGGGRSAPTGRRFEDELRAALDRFRLEPGAAVFLYAGDVWQLVPFLNVAVDYPTTRFVVNLMRSHAWLQEPPEAGDAWGASLVGLLGTCLAAASGTNVEVAVDSEALAQDVERLTGRPVTVWPMIALSAPTTATAPKTATAPNNGAERNGIVNIVAPVHAQGAKGFNEVVGLAERLSDRLIRGDMRFTARAPSPGLTGGILRLAARFEELGGVLVPSHLTDEEFAALVACADVTLVPYPVRPFRTRTSAVVVDALRAGKPVVAVRGTWAGDLVERHGAGLTYGEGNLDELEGALSQVIGRIGEYRERLAKIRAVVEEEHAPERLIRFLLGQRANHPPARTEVAGLGETAARLRHLYQWRASALASALVTEAVSEDDQRRVADTLRDEVDGLRRGVRYRDRTRLAKEEAARSRRLAAVGRTRGEVIRQALRGPLRLAVATTGVLSVVGAGLALTGNEMLAVVSVAGAAIASAVGVLVVAVRLQRRV